MGVGGGGVPGPHQTAPPNKLGPSIQICASHSFLIQITTASMGEGEMLLTTQEKKKTTNNSATADVAGIQGCVPGHLGS